MEELSNDFDVLDLKNDKGPMVEVFEKAVEVLNKHFKQVGTPDKNAAEKMKSKHLFAIKAELQVKKIAKPIYFVIVEGVVIMLYQVNKSSVYDAISMSSLTNITMGQDFPQAAALELTPELAKATCMSHIVIESENMGLLLKYVLEKEYKISIDFSADITLDGEIFFFKTLG